jgi:hypothetical protein
MCDSVAAVGKKPAGFRKAVSLTKEYRVPSFGLLFVGNFVHIVFRVELGGLDLSAPHADRRLPETARA